MSIDFTNKHRNTWSKDRVPRREALKVSGIAVDRFAIRCAGTNQASEEGHRGRRRHRRFVLRLRACAGRVRRNSSGSFRGGTVIPAI
jgi:hypothetical protein